MVAELQGERTHRGFGRSVVIDDFTGGVQLGNAVEQFLGERLAAGDQIFSRQYLASIVRGEKRGQVRGHDLQHVNVVLVEIASQTSNVGGFVVADQVNRSAGDQGGEDAGVAQVGGNR